MVNRAEMRFQVQGSALTPYQLTAYGAGDGFQMFCTCPAGRMARRFCKHMAALLMGEIGALVAPSDDIVNLVERAKGSHLLALAYHHQPRPARPTRALDADLASGLDKALASVIAEARAAGWVVTSGATRIGLHRLSKRGKPLQQPTVAFWLDDEAARKPFVVMAPEGAGRSFGIVEHAAACFAEAARRFAPEKPGTHPSPR